MQLSKNSLPFLLLIVLSGFWAYFYQTTNVINDFGKTKPEWLLLIDGLIVLPIVCFLCIEDKKQAAIKAIAYSCLIVLLGAFIIPESSKVIWPYLESGRYIVLIAFIVLEVTTIATVFLAIKASLNQKLDPDLAISQPIEKVLGSGAISKLLAFEARVWTYALFSNRIKQQYFAGTQHFYGYKKDGAQSNQLGFILIILFELPVMHLLLHYLWSPTAANIVTLLTIMGLTFFVAEYKALAIRPTSLTKDHLIIRYGVWQPVELAFSDIMLIQNNTEFVKRANDVQRFNLSGNPNVEIQLTSGERVYLGVDTPAIFISTLQQQLQEQ